MKHHFVALFIGLSVPVTFPSCMTADTTINALEQQIAAVRASLAREQARTRQLFDERRALESAIAREGSNPQKNSQLQRVNQAIDANAAEKARLQQDIRRLERENANRVSG